MDGACSMNWRRYECTQNFSLKPPKERDSLVDLIVDVILKLRGNKTAERNERSP